MEVVNEIIVYFRWLLANPVFDAFGVVTIFIAFDFATGITKAAYEGNISSKKLKQGLFHKLAYWLLLIAAWWIETANAVVNIGLPCAVYLPTCVGITLIESVSILENIASISPELKRMKIFKILAEVNSDNENNENEGEKNG